MTLLDWMRCCAIIYIIFMRTGFPDRMLVTHFVGFCTFSPSTEPISICLTEL